MELIEIVDKNGEFTGQILDKDEAHDKNLLHNEVATFVLNDNGQILLQKRSANKRFDPNKWGLCAGHVDAGENLEDAALREIKEEIGLDVPKGELYPFGEKEFVIKDSNSHVANFYYIKTNLDANDFVIQEEELSEVKWFNIDDVIEMIKQQDGSTVFNPGEVELFERLKSIR